MSKTLSIWREVEVICEEAGLDPESVKSIFIAHGVVQFILESGEFVFHPWTPRAKL